MNKRKIKKALKRIYYLPKNKYLLFYLANKIRHFYLKLIKSTKVAYPSTIMIELTNHCNLACTICPREYNYGKEMDKGTMDIKQAKKIIDEVHPYLDSIGLTGMGETFMYKELEDVVDYIKNKNKGIIISISTNAVLPNFLQKVETLVGKIDTIQVSIDGIEDVYNSIRVKSDFKLLNNNLRKLASLCKTSKTDLMLNMVVTKENYTHMSKLVNYAENIGINYLDFTMLNLASVTNVPTTYYEFYQSKEFLKAVSELELAISNTNKLVITSKNFQTDNSFQKCPFPWSHFYICQDSYIAPCCAKPFPKEKNFGNVSDIKVIDILNSSEFRNWRRLWFKDSTPAFCDKCHFVNM